MAAPLIVIGGGGFAQEVVWLAEECGREVRGFLDDGAHQPGDTLLEVPWLGPTARFVDHPDAELAVAIGNPRTRRTVVTRLEAAGAPRWATLVHPGVRHARSVSFGPGSLVCAGVVVTVDVVIGRHGILNLNTTVGHNCRFGDFVTLAPLVAISGNVTLGDLVEVGTGACVRQGLALGAGSMLGMGGVATKPIEPDAIYVGNPARYMKSFAPAR